MSKTVPSAVKWLAYLACGVAVACALAAAFSGIGYRLDLWDYRTGFMVLRWSAYIAAGAGVVALVTLAIAAIKRARNPAVAALVGAALALMVVVPGWNLQRIGGEVPRIHDITTDTDNPPQWVALLPVREKASNGAKYAGEKLAQAQKAAYPDIQPLKLQVPPARAFERALAAAKAMDWEIAAAEAAQGRIEATATTRWFGFKDDVVIRITSEGDMSRIDVRSMSRVGRSDLGTNARRIRAYLARVLEQA